MISIIECADYLASFDPRGWSEKALKIATQALELKNKTLLVCKDDGEEVGFAAFLETDEVFLLSLATKRPGYGRRLIERLKQRNKPIWCGSEPESEGFYRRLGFIEDGKHDGFTRFKLHLP